jgi:hypothetical protein
MRQRRCFATSQARGEPDAPIDFFRIRLPVLLVGGFLADEIAALANSALTDKHGSWTGFPSSSF